MAKIYYGKRYNSRRTGNIYIYIKEATCRFPTSLSLFFLFLFHLRIALDGIFFLYDISTQRRPPGSYSLKFFKTQTPIQEPSMSWLCVVIFFKKMWWQLFHFDASHYTVTSRTLQFNAQCLTKCCCRGSRDKQELNKTILLC